MLNDFLKIHLQIKEGDVEHEEYTRKFISLILPGNCSAVKKCKSCSEELTYDAYASCINLVGSDSYQSSFLIIVL